MNKDELSRLVIFCILMQNGEGTGGLNHKHFHHKTDT